MTTFPHQSVQSIYRPEDDPNYGQRGGLTQPAREVKAMGMVDYLRAHCHKLPEYGRVMAKLQRRTK